MKTIKKLVLLLICFVVLLTSLTSPASAILDPEEHQAMLDDGYTYDPDLDSYLFDGEDYAFFDVPSLFLASSPNFPSFNPNMVPWESAPDYIKEILYNTPFISTTVNKHDYVEPWKIPFVLVLTNGDIVRVIVGINLIFGTYYSSENAYLSETPTGSYVFCEVLDSSSNVLPGVEYSCIYESRYYFDTMEVAVDWHSLAPISVGNKISRFTGNLCGADLGWDYYLYGGNNLGPGYNQRFIEPNVKQSAQFPSFVSFTDPDVGFSNSSLLDTYSPVFPYPHAYFSPFIPSTYEDKQLETNKGIWASVKELPSKIADSVKGFFTGLGDRISGFFDKLINYLLYFQPDKPEHVNPFSDILTDIKLFFNNQISDVSGFKNLLNSTLDNIVNYIQTGSSLIDALFRGVPMLNFFVTFFVIFCIVRKVIGR